MEAIQLHVVGLPPKFGWSSSPSRLKRNGLLERKKLVLGFPPLKASADKEGVSSEVEGSGEKKETLPEWKQLFLGEVLSPYAEMARTRRRKKQSDMLNESYNMDWCVKARRTALRAIEGKGLIDRVEKMVTPKKKKKKKNKEKSEDLDPYMLDAELDGGTAENQVDEDIDDLSKGVGLMADGIFKERSEAAMGAFKEKLSRFSGPSDRRKEIILNKAVIDAQTAEEVLEVVSETLSSVAKGLKPSPLTPLNIATALHRIAKNMEKSLLMETMRLSFARQREMSLLVAIAMTSLPECSAQGISNIAWALSKIGGEMIYLSEMDRIADVAITKVGDFNAQNVANVAGAFASMHHAVPALFSRLSARATELVHTFQEQELAQLLWAFASLNEPADELLDALDIAYKDYANPSPLEDFVEAYTSLEMENIEDLVEEDISLESEDIKDPEGVDINDEIENTEDLEVADISDDIENIKEIEGGDLCDVRAKEAEENGTNEEIGNADDVEPKPLSDLPAQNFSRDQLANMAWSIAVLGQMDRPFFSYLWRTLRVLSSDGISDQNREDVSFVTQVLLVNQCLKIEYPHLELSLDGALENELLRIGKTRRFNEKKTSAFQKEVVRLLVSTGLEWAREYRVDGYSLDAVLPERKLALEIDGPTHFSRNLGTPLGHSVLKRRYMAAAGWKVVSLSIQEWENIQGEFERLEYLRRILDLNSSDPQNEKTAAVSEQTVE